jgi:hypothetical protein
MEFAMSHKDIARQNVERQILEDGLSAQKIQVPGQTTNVITPPTSNAENPGMPGGISKAMSTAAAMTS